jgi:hypothetical protein
MTIVPSQFSCAALGMAIALIAGSTSHAQYKAQVTEGPSLPIAVGGHAGGLVDGHPVIVGGSGWTEDRKTKFWSEKTFIYRAGQWATGPSLPAPVADMAYAADDSGLYFVGGTSGKTPTRQTFHLASSKPDAEWQTLTPFPHPIEAAAGAIDNGVFYVADGFADGKASTALWSLNLKQPDAGWTARAPLPAKGRGYSAMVAAAGSIYLFGGFTLPPYQATPEIFADAWRYDPAADQWTELKGFDLPGYAWTATRVDDDHIMLTGRAPKISVIERQIRLLNLNDLSQQVIGELVIQSCCMPVIPMTPLTWWIPGGEPATDRSRTRTVSVVTIEGESKHD